MDALFLSQASLLETPSQVYILAAGFAVLSHVLYYIHGNKVPQTVGILTFHILAAFLLLVAFISGKGLIQGLLSAIITTGSYFSALFTSIVIYRVFFHPLRHFPGPLAAKVSKLYNIWIAKDLHEHQNKWVETYRSPIIRIAPNELLLTTIDAQQKIHGAQAQTSKKNTFYELINYHGASNLDSILNREEHRWRRQVWDRAMNGKALERYENYAREACHDWLDKIASMEGKPMNTSLYSLLIPFDNMGKMGYSADFGTIASGTADRMLHLIEVSLAAIGNIGQLTWPIALSKDLDLSSEQKEFEDLACRVVDEREMNDSEEKEDIMKYFLEDYRSEKPKAFFDRNILYSDSQAIMIGGTDTIAAALSYCFYYLARDSSLRGRLREELATIFGSTIPNEFTQTDASTLPLLNSIIDETMRMHSAVGNNGARSTPPEGITVDGQYIPGNVTVFVGIHAMHRSPQYFRQPDEFIPERWTTRPELVLDKRAFHPFLIGPFNCVGRRLALTVLRLVLSYTVWHYDFEFAPEEDGTRIFTEASNQLIIKAGKLECVFTKRT